MEALISFRAKGSLQVEKKSVKSLTLLGFDPSTPKSVKIHMIIKILLCISGQIRPF